MTHEWSEIIKKSWEENQSLTGFEWKRPALQEHVIYIFDISVKDSNVWDSDGFPTEALDQVIEKYYCTSKNFSLFLLTYPLREHFFLRTAGEFENKYNWRISMGPKVSCL